LQGNLERIVNGIIRVSFAQYLAPNISGIEQGRVAPAFLCVKYWQVLQVFFMPKISASVAVCYGFLFSIAT
jgi:hypothetical protein